MLCDALLPHQGAAENVKHIEEFGQLAGDYALASLAPEQGHGAARRKKRIWKNNSTGMDGRCFLQRRRRQIARRRRRSLEMSEMNSNK
jgi:hypothetical protein